MERPDEPTPICPKKSPQHEAEYILSAENRRVWELFLALQAGAEMTDAEKRDPMLRRKLAMLTGLWEQRRQEQQGDLVTSLAMLMIGKR